METPVCTTEMLKANAAGTYDFSGPIELVKAIDLAMRHYFDADRWVTVRNRLFPGLQTTV